MQLIRLGRLGLMRLLPGDGFRSEAPRLASGSMPADPSSRRQFFGKEKPAGLRLPVFRNSRTVVLVQMVFANATAVSDMRLEKPHSLSYQERTRTNLPSMTLV